MGLLFYTVIAFALVYSTECKCLDTTEIKDDNDTTLALECIQSVKNGNYDEAAIKLDMIKDDNRLWYIVKELSMSNKNNYLDLLLNFGENIKLVTRRFLLYKILYNEFQTRNSLDVIQMAKLLDYTKKLSATSNVIDGKELINNIKSSIKQIMRAKIISEMFSGYQPLTKVTIHDLNKIQQYDPEFTYEIINSIVLEMFDTISTVRLLGLFESPSNIAIRTWGILATYDAINKTNATNVDCLVTLAIAIKKLQNEADYKEKSSQKIINDIDMIKQILPKCVQNAVFPSKSCIKSVKFNEYLYAANGYNYDKDRRRVFTWIPGSKGDKDQESWIFEHGDGSNFYIKNVAVNEYIYAARGFNHDKERRAVFTWIPGTKEEKGYEYWNMEIKGDYCYIKNIKVDEYLYPVIGLNYDKKRRELATWIPKGCDDQCLWKIEDCGGYSIIDIDVRGKAPGPD